MNRSRMLIATDNSRSLLGTALAILNISYTPSGYSHRADTNGTRSGFTGEIAELSSNHYALGQGYRLYNPVLARFHSPDSFSPFGEGGLNTYGYCDGDPVNYSDPTGHMPRASAGAALQRIQKSFASRQAKARWKTARWERETRLDARADRYDKAVAEGADFESKIVAKKFKRAERHSLEAMKSYQVKVRNTFSFRGAHPSANEAFAAVRPDGTGIGLYVEHLQIIQQFYKTKAMYGRTPRIRESAHTEFSFAHNNLKAYMHKHRNRNPNKLLRVGSYDEVLKKYKIRDASRTPLPYDDTYIE